MKIRNRYLIKAAGFGAAWILRAWMATLRYRYQPLGPDVDPSRPGFDGRYIYSCWHETLLQPVYRFCGLGIRVLISQHADGQLLTEVCRSLDIPLVRGSTTRGGIPALRQLLRAGRQASLAITPDGPRGPRRQVQMGMIYLASQTGMPIVPVGFGFRRAWRFRSWDRFAFPRPCTLGTCVTTDPIAVPPDAERAELEHYRQLVEQSMSLATDAAERWAEYGKWPGVRDQESGIRSQESGVRGQGSGLTGGESAANSKGDKGDGAGLVCSDS